VTKIVLLLMASFNAGCAAAFLPDHDDPSLGPPQGAWSAPAVSVDFTRELTLNDRRVFDDASQPLFDQAFEVFESSDLFSSVARGRLRHASEDFLVEVAFASEARRPLVWWLASCLTASVIPFVETWHESASLTVHDRSGVRGTVTAETEVTVVYSPISLFLLPSHDVHRLNRRMTRFLSKEALRRAIDGGLLVVR
jgi:hypothetical protein